MGAPKAVEAVLVSSEYSPDRIPRSVGCGPGLGLDGACCWAVVTVELQLDVKLSLDLPERNCELYAARFEGLGDVGRDFEGRLSLLAHGQATNGIFPYVNLVTVCLRDIFSTVGCRISCCAALAS